MTPDRRLSVTADLHVEVGGSEATVTASGGHVTVRADSPATLWSELNRAALPSSVGRVSGPRAVGRAAELLRDNGVDVQIEGPDGVLVRLGTGVHSSRGRLLTGSSAVQLVSLRSLRPIATAAVLQSVPLRRSVGVSIAVVAGIAVAVGFRRRPRGQDQ